MNGRKPTAEEKKYMESVVSFGCIVCLVYHEVQTPCEIHHTDGSQKEGAHLKTIGLCFRHHREGSDCKQYVSIHPHKARFEARYGTEQELLEITKEVIKRYGHGPGVSIC